MEDVAYASIYFFIKQMLIDFILCAWCFEDQRIMRGTSLASPENLNFFCYWDHCEQYKALLRYKQKKRDSFWLWVIKDAVMGEIETF